MKKGSLIRWKWNKPKDENKIDELDETTNVTSHINFTYIYKDLPYNSISHGKMNVHDLQRH